MKSRWDFVDPVPWSEGSRDIAFIRDLDGPVSVTNEAEAVYAYIREQWPNLTRVVYQGTDGEWWEIDGYYHGSSRIDVKFKPWHGVVWDRLSRINK